MQDVITGRRIKNFQEKDYRPFLQELALMAKEFECSPGKEVGSAIIKLNLVPGKHRIKAKVRRYPPDQRRFLYAYVERMLDMGFLAPSPTASWQESPSLVPKIGKAMFRVTSDLLPLNDDTIKEVWPIPPVDSKIQYFSGCTCF